MDPDPHSGGWHTGVGVLAPDRFAGLVRFPPRAIPAVVTCGAARAGAASETPWQSLERGEQEALIVLMAELALRAARGEPTL